MREIFQSPVYRIAIRTVAIGRRGYDFRGGVRWRADGYPSAQVGTAVREKLKWMADADEWIARMVKGTPAGLLDAGAPGQRPGVLAASIW